MLWGLIPFWHHGSNPTDHKLTTNNARIEGIKESRLYKPSLEKDRRCVVICDGFYEWQKLKDGGTKQPYLVYAHQKKQKHSQEEEEDCGGRSPVATSNKLEDNWSEDGGWTGPRPLFMAGLYSVWYSDDDKNHKKPVYSYTVITRSVLRGLLTFISFQQAVRLCDIHSWSTRVYTCELLLT